MLSLRRSMISTGLALLLAACGASLPVRYYGLEPVAAAYRPDAGAGPVLALGPLQVPEYLRRPQIVTRGPGAELSVDEFSRWAEPVDEAVHRVLAANVDALVDGLSVLAFPHNSLIEADYRLVGRIDRFDVDETGTAVLAVQWSISDRDRRLVVAPRRSRFEAAGGDPGDKDAVARALSETIEQFSRQIAGTLQSALRPAT